MASSEAKLIINADDFGLTEAVSEAVVAVFKNGSATSASLMTAMPSAAHAARLARQNPELGVGLHFTLTEGWSVQDKPTPLVREDGRFYGRSQLILRLASGLISPADVERELKSQYGRLRDLGIAPTHIDSHQHVHVYPPIFQAVAELARAERLPVRLPRPQAVRRPGFSADPRFLYRESKHALISLLVKRCEALADELRCTGSFSSVFDLYPFRAPSPEDYQLLIEQRGSSLHELMIHPYVLSAQLKGIYGDGCWYRKKGRFFESAQGEYAALSRFSVAEWLRQSRVPLRLISYRDL